MPDEKSPGVRGSLLKEAQDLGVANANFVKEALKWQYNWIGLAGAAAFALVSGTGFPLVLAAGLELIYISVVPQSSRFRRLVRSWQYAEEKRRIDVNLQAMYKEIPPEMQVRYGRLDQLCRGIRENYGQLSSTSQMFVKEMQGRLDGLMQGYLRCSTPCISIWNTCASRIPTAFNKSLPGSNAALPPIRSKCRRSIVSASRSSPSAWRNSPRSTRTATSSTPSAPPPKMCSS